QACADARAEHDAEDGGHREQRQQCAAMDVNPCRGAVDDRDDESAAADRDLHRRRHQEVQRRDVGEAGAESEHAAEEADRGERSGTGPAASVPESANSSPTPRTKSRWKGKKLPMMGTNSTPPPTPASAATMPMMKLTAKRAIGQIHHGSATPSAAVAGPDAASARRRTATWIKRRFFKLCSHYAEARREFIDAVPADRFSRPL